MNRRDLLKFACAALLPWTTAAAMAQDFPGKVIRIVSPYSAGAGPDIAARATGEKLGALWGRAVVVDARPGGNGFIALEAGKKAAPSGNDLILVGNAHMTINPALFRKLPYNPTGDFVPVGLMYNTPFFVAVAPNGPYRTLRDLVDAAKKEPGRISYGSPYVGSPSHLGSALLESMTGTQMIHVPFKDALQIFTSVANGDVSWGLGTVGTTAALVQAGKIKLIAVAASERLADYPDVPTVNEALGLSGYEVDAWVALLAPKGTPDAVIHRINADLNKVLAMPGIKEKYAAMGFVPAPATPEQLGRIIRDDIRKYAEIVKRSGAAVE